MKVNLAQIHTSIMILKRVPSYRCNQWAVVHASSQAILIVERCILKKIYSITGITLVAIN